MKLPSPGQTVGHIVLLGLLYGQLNLWNNPLLGLVLLIAWIGMTGMWWKHILVSLFGLKRHNIVSDIIGGYTAFSLLGFVSSVFVVWYTLTPFFIWICFLLASCITFFIYSLASHRSFARIETEYLTTQIRFKQTIIFGKSRLIIFLFVVVLSVAAYLLYTSRAYVGVLFSPWQSIHSTFITLFFILNVLVGILLFSKYKTSSLLFLLLLLSFLTHAYIPLSHTLPWGGDVWRHMGVEQKIMDGGMELPVLFGPEAKYRDIGSVSAPEALVIPHKYAYGHLWSSTLIIGFVTQVDLMTINKWLVPFLWSLMVPILLYRIGMKLFHSPRKGLWLAWLSLLVFPLQALGGLTIPVSFGCIFFVFMLWLVLHYIREQQVSQFLLVLFFSAFMFFGYTLYALLIAALLIMVLVVNLLKKIRFVPLQRVSYVIVGLLSVGILPTVELLAKISYFSSGISWFFNLKQMVGQFSGLFFAQAIRPHDILSGNIIFNHTPEIAFVASVFINFRWHILVGMLCLLALCFYAFLRICISENSKTWLVVGLLGASIVGGYILGWYVLVGDRTFIRRIDPVFTLVLLLGFMYGLQFIVPMRESTMRSRIPILLSIIGISWFGTTVYASGPDIRVVSADEYHTAQRVWNMTNEQDSPPCVLADTWVLLALEAVSGKQIVGGGFPMDNQFGQQERVELYEGLIQAPSQALVQGAHTASQNDRCIMVLPAEDISDEKVKIVDTLTHNKAIFVSNMYIWESNLKKGVE